MNTTLSNSYNRYLNSASLYDADNRPKVQDDIPFYVELAGSITGKILELGCGTGRITLPILATGKTIYGIDDSQAMLDVLAEKLLTLEESARKRITVIPADMSDFSIHEKFELIILPYSTFQGLCRPEEIMGCFRSVKSHLSTGGTFVFSCFKPNGKLTQSWVTQDEKTDFVVYDDCGNKLIERKSINREIDTESQLIYCDLFYYLYDTGHPVQVKSDQLKMRYYYPDQLEELINNNGFTVKAKYGYFDKRDFEDASSTQMIYQIAPK